MEARLRTGPYRVVPDEVLELTMSSFLGAVTSEETVRPDQVATINCRVNDAGSIFLPVVGEVPVAGKSLPEIEASVLSAYYPKYARTYPSVFAKVAEYKKFKVAINGAVTKPGVYELRRDQMSLVTLIMEANGITVDGAADIRIDRPDAEDVGFGTGTKSLDPSLFGSGARHSSGAGSGSDGAVRLAAAVRPMGREDALGLTMSFRPDCGKTTTGWLSLGRAGRVLVQEHVDVSVEEQRWGIVKQLAAREPGLPLPQVDRQLSDLASTLCSSGASLPRDAGLGSTVGTVRLADYETSDVVRSVPAEGLMQGLQPVPGSAKRTTVVLPIKGINIPFVDVALREGDRVTVERLVVPLFSVIGLVQKPGNFPYPPDARYTLAQAIAFAGDVKQEPQPRYVVVYRLRSDGSIIHAAFEIPRLGKSGALDDPATVLIRPGDIVAVEPTLRTRTTEFVKSFFHFNMGAYIPITTK